MTPLRVAAMIAVLHPQMPVAARLEYGVILSTDPDPATAVSVIEHESRFNASARGGIDGQCVGLGQSCLKFNQVCRDGYEAASCVAERDRLLDGSTAARRLVADFARWRRFCRRATGHAARLAVLSGYSGSDRHGITCGQRRVGRQWVFVRPSKAVAEIEAIRSRLVKGLFSSK